MRQTFCCHRVDDILASLSQIEEAIEQQGLWAAGWLSYEASPAFDPALEAHPAGDFPLLWIGLFAKAEPIDVSQIPGTGAMLNMHWQPNIERDEYDRNIQKVKTELREGNSYQVNLTFRQQAEFDVPAAQAFRSFACRARYGALIETERFSLCSASPELFFEKHDHIITCRPMKGTAARGRYYEEDQEMRDELATSEKNQAENLMIVDMIRNDLGKIATTGSVKVSGLFSIEQYPTVWQMTSTVKAKSTASLVELFTALYPCASITGAPKANTMGIIRALESSPRSIYTGSIGFVRPNGDMQFNVAIRSLLIDKTESSAEYGVGGGIVWDSQTEDEYQECLIKTRILHRQADNHHRLLETLLWEPESGFFLLDYHLKRLQQSAVYFGYHIDSQAITQQLQSSIETLNTDQRVRLLVNEFGEADITTTAITNSPAKQTYRVALASRSIDKSDWIMFHKTTDRECYQSFAREYPDYDDVLLHNSKGEFTESLIANLIIKIDGKQYTPPVSCGLLAGTYREYLLDQGLLSERVITRQELDKAEAIYLGNSVRKLWPISIGQ